MVLLVSKSSYQWIIVHPSSSQWKSLNKFLNSELKREEVSFCSWYGQQLVIPDITKGRWWWQMLTFWQCHWLQEPSHHLPKVKNGRLCCWLKYRLEMQRPSQSFFLSFWTWVLYACHHKPIAFRNPEKRILQFLHWEKHNSNELLLWIWGPPENME